MRKSGRICTLFLLLGLMVPCRRAAAQDVQNVDPDRPDVTNGTHIVEVGMLQVEFGGLYNRSAGSQRDTATPTTIRVGLTEWLEVRVESDGFLRSNETGPVQMGIGDVQLGAKLRLWADPGGIPVLSIVPEVSLPAASAAKGLGSGQSDWTLTLLTGTDFLKRGHVDVNVGSGLIGAGPGLHRFPQHMGSISTSAEIPGPVTPYAEFYWYSRQSPGAGHMSALDAGAIYVVNPRFAIDGGVQKGLSVDAPRFSAFAGVSVLVGNVLGNHGIHARARQAAKRAAAVEGKHAK